MTILFLSLVFFSGFSGLVYEVAWQKYLAIFLGSHAFASTLILAGFFLFLSAGNAVIGRLLEKRRSADPLLLYGTIEGLIGIYALLTPRWFHFLESTFPHAVGGSLIELTSGFTITCLFLGLPTFLMGGTIPLLSQGLARELRTSHRVHAAVYATNTLGAFAGAVIAGFVLIEQFGLAETVLGTGLLNLSIFVAAMFSRIFHSPITETKSSVQALPVPARTRVILLGIAFLSGFYTFSIENIFIRVAGLTLGSTSYTFSIIVASVILSIALGSATVAFFRDVRSLRLLMTSQVALFASLALLYISVPYWPILFFRLQLFVAPTEMNFLGYWFAALALFTLILCVPFALMGMTLPLLFNHLRERVGNISAVVGNIYGINAVGCAVGSLFGGYYLFHWLTDYQILKLSFVAVAVSLLLIARLHAGPARTLGYVIPSLAVGLLLVLPAWAPQRFLPSIGRALPKWGSKPTFLVSEITKVQDQIKLVYVGFDPGAMVGVKANLSHGSDGRPVGSREIIVNGKSDGDTYIDRRTMNLISFIPLALRPAESVFVVGLGTGQTVSAATLSSDVKSVEVGEMSERVIDALPEFDPYNHYLSNRRHKVQIVQGDAYKVLKSRQRRDDLILSEPSNPWVAGVENLFSQEYLREAASKLTEHGIYAHWVQTYEMGAPEFRTALKTFRSVFPWVTVWNLQDADLLLLGSSEEPRVDFARLEPLYRENQELLRDLGLNHPLSLLGSQILSARAVDALLRSPVSIHSLYRPILGYMAGRSFFSRTSLDLNALLTVSAPFLLRSGDPASRLIYETYPGKLPPEFYRDSLANADGIESLIERMKLSQALAQSSTRWNDSERLAAYLLGRGPLPPSATSVGTLKRVEGMLQSFDKLGRWQVAADPRQIALLLPKACEEENCFLLKGEVLGRKRPDHPTLLAARQTKPLESAFPSIEAAFQAEFFGESPLGRPLAAIRR